MCVSTPTNEHETKCFINEHFRLQTLIFRTSFVAPRHGFKPGFHYARTEFTKLYVYGEKLFSIKTYSKPKHITGSKKNSKNLALHFLKYITFDLSPSTVNTLDTVHRISEFILKCQCSKHNSKKFMNEINT